MVKQVGRSFAQSNAFMREKSPRFAGDFTAQAVTLNFSKSLNMLTYLIDDGKSDLCRMMVFVLQLTIDH